MVSFHFTHPSRAHTHQRLARHEPRAHARRPRGNYRLQTDTLLTHTNKACRSTARTPTDADDLPRDHTNDGLIAPPQKPFAGRFQYLVAYCEGCDPTQRLGEASRAALPTSASVASADGRNDRDAEHEFSSEYCDCDRFQRWICHPCQEMEKGEYMRYTRRRFDPSIKEKVDGERSSAEEQQRANNVMFLPWTTANGSAISMVSKTHLLHPRSDHKATQILLKTKSRRPTHSNQSPQILCPCGQPAHRLSHLWCFLCSRRHRSTTQLLQNGLAWRSLWFGSDKDWDEMARALNT